MVDAFGFLIFLSAVLRVSLSLQTYEEVGEDALEGMFLEFLIEVMHFLCTDWR